jgi:hypothetical protein
MKPPICPVCGQYCAGEYIRFADFRMPPPGVSGHPNGYECFCENHSEAARHLSHLPVHQAISIITGLSKQPPVRQSVRQAEEPQRSIVFEQQKGTAAGSALILLMFSIAMLFFSLIGLVIVLNELKLRSGGIQLTDVLFILGFLLVGLSGTAIFGYYSYQGFKLSRSKRPRLTLNHEGFIDLALGEAPILWRDVTDMKFQEKRIRRTLITRSYINISLNEMSEFKRNSSVLKNLFRKVLFLGYDLQIPVSFLTTNASTVFAAFESYYIRFGRPR